MAYRLPCTQYLKSRARGAFIRELQQQRFSAESVVIHCSAKGAAPGKPMALNSAHAGQPIYLCGPAGIYGRRAPVKSLA